MSAIFPTTSTPMAPEPLPYTGADNAPPQMAAPDEIQPVTKLDDLSKEDQARLLAICETFEKSIDISRLQIVKQTQQAREFWKGLHYIRWNAATSRWDPITQAAPKDTQGDPDPIVLNLFQRDGKAIIAALSVTAPRGVCLPEDAENPQDVATAEQAVKIVRRFENVNQIESLIEQEAFHACCDGYYGLYIRHKVDGERFGFDERPILRSVPMAHPMDPTMTVMSPQPVGTTRIARGEEVVDPFGALELKIPAQGRRQCDFPFWTAVTEVHRAMLRNLYGEAAEALKGGYPGSASTSDASERTARLSLANAPPGYEGRLGNVAMPSLVTFKRTWIRNWAFAELDEKDEREKFSKMFPDGAYVAYAEGQMLDVRNESGDKHWVIVMPLPGDGAAHEPVLGSFIPVQRVINRLADTQLQTHEFGIPPIFIDESMLNLDAFADTPVKPAMMYPLKIKPGQNAGQSYFSPPALGVSEQSIRFRQELQELGQTMTGAVPALTGTEMQAAGKTASGYAMARDVAMGNIGLIYRAIKRAHAELNRKVVNVFYEARKGGPDVRISERSEDGSFRNDTIRIADLGGEIRWVSEAQEDIPVTWAQKKNFWVGLLASPNPSVQALAASPENIAAAKRALGADDVHVPGEDAQKEQDAETKMLISQKPIPGPMQPVVGPMGPMVDPMTGQPQMQIGSPQPSVPIDPMDNHAIHYARCQQFKESAEGRKLRVTNPAGWMNFHLHAMAHQAAMQPPMPPFPPPGGGQPTPPMPGTPQGG